MKPVDIIIIAAIAVVAAAIIAYILYKKCKGEKIGCGCGCKTCPHAGACHGNAVENAENAENAKDTDGAQEVVQSAEKKE